MVRRLLKNKYVRLFGPIAVGVLIVVLALGSPSTPTRTDKADRSLPVKVDTVTRESYTPTIKGYGRVRPARHWTAVAQVAGPLSFVHPDLEQGAVFQEAEMVVRIDPAEYQYKVSRLEAQLNEHQARQTHLASLLEIKQELLELEEREFGRTSSLAQRGSASKARLDEQQRDLLGRKRDVESGRLELETLRAGKGSIEADLALARLQLKRTAIVLPFPARIATVTPEVGAFVRVGDELFTADAIDRVEIEAKFTSEDFIGLLPRAGDPRGGDPSDFFEKGTAGRVRSSGLSGHVTYSVGDYVLSWNGDVERYTGAVDPTSGTVSVIIGIDQPRGRDTAGRPPLAKGMLVDAHLSGRAIVDALVVSSKAVQNGQLAVVGGDNHIEIRDAHVQYAHKDYTILKSGVAPGDKVVVSSFLPEADGMKVEYQTQEPGQMAAPDQ